MSTLIPIQRKTIHIVKLALTISILLVASCKKIEGELEIRVLTGAVTLVGNNYCLIQGEIVDLGGTVVDDHGFCYGETENPTISDTRSRLGNKNTTGVFSDSIAGLESNTTYYLRAYATNESGTGYGVQVTFKTTSSAPSVTTSAVSNITGTSAQGGGNVADDGGGEVTSKGICWSTSTEPTIADNHTTDGSGTGGFTSVITGLSCSSICNQFCGHCLWISGAIFNSQLRIYRSGSNYIPGYRSYRCIGHFGWKRYQRWRGH